MRSLWRQGNIPGEYNGDGKISAKVAGMQTLRQPLADADLIALSHANPGWRVEIHEGRLIMSPPTGWNSGRRNSALTTALNLFAEAHGFVSLDSSAGVHLPNGDVLSADGTLVTSAQWNSVSETQRDGIPAVVPIVVVELRSKSDRMRTLVAKCEDWFEQGVAHVVLLNPFTHEIRTWGVAPSEFPDLHAIVK